MRPGLGGLFDARQTGLFDRLDLLAEHRQPRRVTADLIKGIRRDRQAFGCQQPFQFLGRSAQFRLEAANAKPDQRRLHPVDDPRPLFDQVLTLAVWAFGIFFLRRRDGDHPAMPPLTTHPSDKYTQQHCGVEPIRLCPTMLP